MNSAEKRFHTHSSLDRYSGTGVTTSPANSPSPLIILSPPATEVLETSSLLHWSGILVEKHASPAGECTAASIDWHVLMLVSGSPAHTEHRTFTGKWHSCINRTDTVTAIPPGPVPPRRLHNSVEFIYCALDVWFVNKVESELDRAPGRRPAYGDVVPDNSVRRIMRLLSDELQRSDAPNRLYAESLGHALAMRYLLAADASVSAPCHSTCSALPPRLLNRVREKIESQLDADLTLQELSQETGYSRAHFLRMFRVATGMTPHQYILDLRLRRAKEHLRRKDMTVTNIARTCGFSSQSHMTSAFRKHLAVTPAEYRRGI